VRRRHSGELTTGSVGFAAVHRAPRLQPVGGLDSRVESRVEVPVDRRYSADRLYRKAERTQDCASLIVAQRLAALAESCRRTTLAIVAGLLHDVIFRAAERVRPEDLVVARAH